MTEESFESDFKISNKKNKGDNSGTVRKMWKQIAQRPSEFDMQVIEALRET